MRRLLPLIVAVLACAFAATPAPAAKITKKKSMWGPVTRDGESQMPIYADLGVGIYQHVLSWEQTAPTRPVDPTNPADPAYNWPAEIDTAISEGSERGITVSLMVISAPQWANGGRDRRWAPADPQDFADFTAAAAKRYPAVRHWMIWSEPTKPSNFQPMANGRGTSGKSLEGAQRYSALLDASYAALKDQSRRNLVIGGNSFTVGAVPPVYWARNLKLANGKRPRMDLWGHNPFSARVPRLKAERLSDGYSDFSDVDDFAKILDRAFRKAPVKRERHLKLFLSEYSLPTDHGNFEFNFHVTRKTQARWLRKAIKIARGYDRIYTFGYLGLYDDQKRPNNDQVERGLITRSGEHKPAYSAFKRS
jgi:hypothetical protein